MIKPAVKKLGRGLYRVTYASGKSFDVVLPNYLLKMNLSSDVLEDEARDASWREANGL